MNIRDKRDNVILVELREENFNSQKHEYTVMFVASNLDKALIWCKENLNELKILEDNLGEEYSVTYYLGREIIDADLGHEFIAWITSDGGFYQERHPNFKKG